MQPLKHEEALKKWGVPVIRYFTYRAMNRLIQGSAADMIKVAMIKIERALGPRAQGLGPKLKSKMILQIHDELVFEVATGELEKLREMVVHEMANVVELRVPLEVHVGIGKTWDAADH